jgi:hypothetical protein
MGTNVAGASLTFDLGVGNSLVMINGSSGTGHDAAFQVTLEPPPPGYTSGVSRHGRAPLGMPVRNTNLFARGLDPSVQYRLTLHHVNPADIGVKAAANNAEFLDVHSLTLWKDRSARQPVASNHSAFTQYGTTSSKPTPTGSASPSETTTSKPGEKKTPIGAILGGVVVRDTVVCAYHRVAW